MVAYHLQLTWGVTQFFELVIVNSVQPYIPYVSFSRLVCLGFFYD